MKTVILGFSLLFAVIYMFFLLVDILRTAFSKLKGVDYQWSTSGFFQECRSWPIVLLLGFLLFLGLYSIGSEYAKINIDKATGGSTYCEECKKKFAAKYKMHIYDEYVCPSCFEEFHKKDIEWYVNALNLDSEDAFIVDAAICDLCGWIAPADLSNKQGNIICIKCANETMRSGNFPKTLDTYKEHVSDDDDYMIVEKSECSWCGNYAPSDLYDENGERICIDCITEALQDSKVARVIRNYIEYG